MFVFVISITFRSSAPSEVLYRQKKWLFATEEKTVHGRKNTFPAMMVVTAVPGNPDIASIYVYAGGNAPSECNTATADDGSRRTLSSAA
jgi:hypothetical protein